MFSLLSENLDPILVPLSEDVEESTYRNKMLLCVDKSQISMGSNIEKRLFYTNHYVDRLITTGENIVRQYKNSNGENITNMFDAQIFNNYIILGSEDQKIIWIYDGTIMKIIKTIGDSVKCSVDKSQLYICDGEGNTNVYDINFNFRYQLVPDNGKSLGDYHAIQHSNNNYCIYNCRTHNINIVNELGLYLNDGKIYHSFNYKNEIKTLDSHDRACGFIQLDNCYVVANWTNLYVIDPTLSTMCYHETMPMGKIICKVVYVGGNYFDIYWSSGSSSRTVHITHYYLNIPDDMYTPKIKLTAELIRVKKISSNVWNPIYFLMRNVPNTQIVKRICFNGTIIEYFSNGSRIKYNYLTKGQQLIKISKQYTVHVLEDKIFFGFEPGILHVFHISTLEFIKTFPDVKHFDTGKNYLCLYKLNNTIEYWDKDLKLCSPFEKMSIGIQTSITICKFVEPSTYYILGPDIKGILIYDISTKNKRLVQTYVYDGEEITIDEPQTLIQLTDDTNNNYWLVTMIDTQTIYLIDSTFKCVVFCETFDFVIGNVKHVSGCCFDIYHLSNDAVYGEVSCVSQYKLKITNDESVDEFVEL